MQLTPELAAGVLAAIVAAIVLGQTLANLLGKLLDQRRADAAKDSTEKPRQDIITVLAGMNEHQLAVLSNLAEQSRVIQSIHRIVDKRDANDTPLVWSRPVVESLSEQQRKDMDVLLKMLSELRAARESNNSPRQTR